MNEKRKCIICGKEFVATRATCLCCSVPCRKERNRQKAYENWQRYTAEGTYADRAKKPSADKAGRTRSISSGASLAEVEAAAREAGMHYGQYVAIMRLRKERNK